MLEIPVAVKFLPKELAARNADYVSLFLREARTAIRIRHKHIIGLYEAGQQNGQYYLTMEFAPGGSVRDVASQSPGGRLDAAKVLRILRETAMGLSAAEEMAIVHRDIKPANLMFGAQGEVKIADLGLAKRLARPAQSGELQASIKAEQLTMLRGDNSIQGTPAYIAPEAALNPEAVDGRSDLYSLGVTAYELLTGRLPFEGTEALQVMMKHLTQPVPPLNQGGVEVPPALEKVVLRLLSKIPDARYQSANDLVKALENVTV